MNQPPEKIKIAVNTNHKNKAPVFAKKEDSDKWFSWYARGFRNVELSIEAWIALIQQGYAFTSQFSQQRRIMANFITSQHVALDFDHLLAGFTIEQVANYDEFIKTHATFIYTTPSHKENSPRYRVVFCLDRPISNRDKYRELLLAIATEYSNEHDPSCKDPVRLFYGSENCQYLMLGNSLSLEDARDKMVLPLREKQEKERLAREEALKGKVIVAKQGVPAEVLQERLDKLLSPLDGLETDKWSTLRRVSYVLGGYVGGSYYDYSTAKDKLEAMVGKMKGVGDHDHAYATIEQALTAGMERPLYFMQEEHKPGELVSGNSGIVLVTNKEIINELEGTTLSDEQKAEVAQRLNKFINDKCWLAYHEGMNEAQKRLWLERYGFDEGIQAIFGLGYRSKRICKETGEITGSAYTVPMRNYKGEVVNVEYVTEEGGVRYEQEDVPSLSYLVNGYFEFKDAPVLVLPDNLGAIDTMLNMPSGFNYAGLPQLTLRPESIDGLSELPHIVVIEPGTRVNSGLRYLPRNTKTLRLPYPLKRLRELTAVDGVVSGEEVTRFILRTAS